MISNNLRRQVRREATNLKKAATSEELNNLLVKELNPNDAHGCIYGQLTGDCYNKRASELLRTCAVPVAKQFNMNEGEEHIMLNSSDWKKDTWKKVRSMLDIRRYYSAIEIYISLATLKEQTDLINYLKGKQSTLKYV